MEEILLTENYEYSDEEYCVKTGKFIPGGCSLLFCEDISNCPYCTQEIVLNDFSVDPSN